MKKNVLYFIAYFLFVVKKERGVILNPLQKKLFISWALIFLFTITGFSQTIKTIKTSGGDFSTFTAAITYLNGLGSAPAGGVVFNVDPAFTSTETCPAITITWGGAGTPVIFQKNGAGTNPLITAGVGANAADAIVTIAGADYITFNGIDLKDPTSNATGNADMEYGYYIKNAAAGNGATFNTITNCKITLQRSNPNTSSYGIYQNVATVPTSAAGANSNNSYLNDTVNNVYNGMYLLSNASFPDLNCAIRGCVVGSTTPNDIGNGSTTNFGIKVENGKNFYVGNTEVKNVTNSSGTDPYGIYLKNSLGTDSLFQCKVHEIKDTKPSSNCFAYGVYVDVASGNTVNVYNNFIYDVFYGNSSGTSNLRQFLLYTNGAGTVNIYFNSILSNSTLTNLSTACIYVNGNTVNILNNILRNDVVCTSNGDSYCLYFASGTMASCDYNNYDITIASRQFVGNNAGTNIPYLTAAQGVPNWQAQFSGQDTHSSNFSTSFNNTTIGSVDLHLLVFVPTPAYNGVATTPAVTNDIDGDARVIPMIGADEVNFTTPYVQVSGSSQPQDSSVSQASFNNVLYGISFTVYNSNTIFSGITVNTNTSSNNNYATSAPTDFNKFQFWLDSTSSSFNPTTAIQLGSNVTNAPAYSGTINFATSRALFSGRTYYLFITDSVGPAGAAGHNINLVTTSLSNIIFSSGTTKTGATGTGGKQTIVLDWYNWGDTYGVGDPRQDASSFAGWYDSTTHSSNPSDFTSSNQRFNVIRNNSTMATTLNLGNAGTTNLHFTVGTGLTALGFSATQPIVTLGGAVVDVKNLDTLRLLTNSVAPAFGSLAVGSNVEYGDTGIVSIAQPIGSANYYNLKLSNLSGGGTKIFPTWLGVRGTFSPGTYFTSASGGAISFDGTTAQTVPAFTYNNLTINNSSGTATTLLSTSATVSNLLTDSTAFTVPVADTLKLGTAATVATLIGTTTINGTLVNNDPLKTTFAGTTTSTLVFGANSNYNLPANLTSTTNNNGQIPAATWASSSTINVTGITTATSSIAVGAPSAAGFGNISFDDSAMTTANSGYKLFGGFSSPITLQGNLVLGRTNDNSVNGMQMTTGTMVINVGGNLIVNAGSYGLANYSGTQSLNVTGNVTIDGTHAYGTSTGYTSPNFVLASKTSGANGTLSVAGNFLMLGTSTLSQNTSGTTGNLKFTGATAQNATFTTVSSPSGPLNMAVTNSTDVVTLLSDLNLPGSASGLSLTGKLAINGNTLTLNGTYASTGISGTLTGSASSKLVIGSTATSIPLTFTYDPLKVNNSLLALTVNANASLASGSTSSSLYIDGGVPATPGSVTVVGSAVFTTSDSLTLKSNAAGGTARIAANTLSSTYVSGKVTVERFETAFRAWRFLTAPLSSTTQNVNASWQEGQANTSLTPINTKPGYGTEITNSTSSSSYLSGYDQGVTNNPSLYYFNNSTHAYGTLAATNTAGSGGYITNYPGYMLFVRGDRSFQISGPSFNASNSTVLRTKGTLNMGDFTTPNLPVGFCAVGNPYASSINYVNVTKTAGLSSNFYLWDPHLATATDNYGVGAFVTLIQSGSTFTAVPDPTHTSIPLGYTGHPFDIDGTIQSGSAFMVSVTSGSTNSLTIHETDKTVPTDNYADRPAYDGTPNGSVRVTLYAAITDTTSSLLDGVLSFYSPLYSDSVNLLEDVAKPTTFSENLGILRSGQLLSVEKRQPVNVYDTTFFNLTRLGIKKYIYEFITSNMDKPGLVGLLMDSYAHTATPVNLNGTTDIVFNTDNNAASRVSNRFMLVFGPPQGGPLPVTFTSVKAAQQNKNIAVQWNVTNQLNIKQYEVEKSTNGHDFSVVNITAAIGNNAYNINYNWTDDNAVAGNNYYRIVSIDGNGTKTYSQVVNVAIGDKAATIAVYPNPVKDGIIGLQLTNMPKGNYGVRLLNNIGQEIMNTQISHAAGSSNEQIAIAKTLAKGIYKLEIISPDQAKTVLSIVY